MSGTILIQRTRRVRNPGGGGGGGGTRLYELYGDVPLDRVWFFAPLP